MTKKIVVIVGAFDRYNYGDNLMPILFELFLHKYYPLFFDNFELQFSALTVSDLSKYKAKKTTAISDIFCKNLDNIHSIISIGGEVLGSSSSTLFSHMSHIGKSKKLIDFLNSNKLNFFTDIYCKALYKLPWEYPYIPKRPAPHIKIALNTIGGCVSRRDPASYIHSVRKRLVVADYLSVRDTRTKESVQRFCSTKHFPDSAVVMSHFASDNFLKGESSARINSLENEEYICFQAAPNKVGAPASKCVEVLKKLSSLCGLKVKLCPIGYASGHDDIDFLNDVEQESNGEFELLKNLNIWEIMSVIRFSKAFIGTSLHGVITALSFSVPTIGLNRRVTKLDRFLSDWGIDPSVRCYSIFEVLDVFQEVMATEVTLRQDHSKYLIELGLKNNHSLVHALGLNEREIGT